MLEQNGFHHRNQQDKSYLNNENLVLEFFCRPVLSVQVPANTYLVILDSAPLWINWLRIGSKNDDAGWRTSQSQLASGQVITLAMCCKLKCRSSSAMYDSSNEVCRFRHTFRCVNIGLHRYLLQLRITCSAGSVEKIFKSFNFSQENPQTTRNSVEKPESMHWKECCLQVFL